MKQPITKIVFMMTVSGFVFAAVSCSKSPDAQQQSSAAPTVSVQQDESGNVVVLLTDKGNNNVWKKKDENNDIFVKKIEGDMLDINMKLTLFNGSIRQIQTRVKVLPGEKVAIGGIGDKKIYIELQ